MLHIYRRGQITGQTLSLEKAGPKIYAQVGWQGYDEELMIYG